MQAALSYVARNPGCVMRDCAHHVSPLSTPSKNEGYGYDIVHRAIKAGLITYTRKSGRYYLTAAQ
jgi:hypothetical protein